MAPISPNSSYFMTASNLPPAGNIPRLSINAPNSSLFGAQPSISISISMSPQQAAPSTNTLFNTQVPVIPSFNNSPTAIMATSPEQAAAPWFFTGVPQQTPSPATAFGPSLPISILFNSSPMAMMATSPEQAGSSWFFSGAPQQATPPASGFGPVFGPPPTLIRRTPVNPIQPGPMGLPLFPKRVITSLFDILQTIVQQQVGLTNAGNSAAKPNTVPIRTVPPPSTAAPSVFSQVKAGLAQLFTQLTNRVQAQANPGNVATGGYGSVAPPTQNATPGTVTQRHVTKDDFIDFLLAGSQGGTTGTAESINGAFSRPGSRFATTGADQFDAATAWMYAQQFKAYAYGLDAAFNPGGAPIEDLATNLTFTQNLQLTPEAELLSKVAAIYRGDIGGSFLYDNPAFKTVIARYRPDIANSDPLIGNPFGDVQTIGAAVKVLNEESNPAVRQQFLQEIFDFNNNSGNGASGAVPNTPEAIRAYQVAIDVVTSGRLDAMMNEYSSGIKTSNGLI